MKKKNKIVTPPEIRFANDLRTQIELAVAYMQAENERQQRLNGMNQRHYESSRMRKTPEQLAEYRQKRNAYQRQWLIKRKADMALSEEWD